ncbi:MAG: tetratricopeptide repeat protein [Acidobacteria bacterium]|nr:tetratricopeptide repeat protein [Acidobacteriota bacterium]MCA1637407.1 tetratricopeptide repeat protein [Acidobacteriota bacterium]
MQRPNFFLRTKLLPPRPVSELLTRPRLTEKLQANLNAPITMVAADAGCGKTTLISDFIRSQSRQSVWYQLDHTDADPFVFLGYISHGIKNIAPEFGQTILPYLSEATNELLQYPERAVDLLLNEILESIEQPFILVLDDYHHIGRDTVVHQLVDRLLQYSTDMMHLIITTRDLPPLAIMRRRTQSRALVLTREDLLFTDEEVRELFRQTLNVELKDEEISEYRKRTHGWITALQLVRQVAEQEIFSHAEMPKLNLQAMLQQSEKDIFDYFAEEVFYRETEETQNLLLHISLLDSMPLDVCSRLFPGMRCSAVLPELVQKNVFLTVAGDGKFVEEYRLHPLFRDFLQRRLRSEIGRAEIANQRNRIADFFLADNHWEKAIPFLLGAENYERAAEIIAEKGGEWLASGAITTLAMFTEKIPLTCMEKFPRALLHKAEIARLQGETDKSVNLLQRTLKFLHKNGDKTGEAEALHSLASLARRKGKSSESLGFLEKAEKLIDENSETFLKCSNTRGLCLIGQGAWTNAEQQFRYALELAEKQNNEQYIRLITHNLALPAGFRGDFGEALRWLRRIFRQDEPDKPMPQEAIGHLNIGRLHLYRGEFDETEKHLERALEICQLYNLRFLRGEIFEAYGNFYRDKNDFTHAGEFYERASKAYEEAEIDPLTRELNEERAKFLFLRGDFVKARAILENLLQARQKTNNEVGIRTVKLNLCRVLLAQGETKAIAEQLKEITAFFHEQNLFYDEAVASLVLAQAYFTQGKRKEMLLPLQRVLDLTARFDYEYWLREEIRKTPDLFRDEDIIGNLPLDLRENLLTIDPKKAVVQQVVSVETTELITDLTVKVLGHTNIYRDKTKPFAPDAWTTRRARDIFCCIATSPHRRIEKDILIDTFWGDEELSAIEKNFHPTISHIRKALNSKQSFKQNFLIFRDGAYQVNPELSYSIDTEDFENHIVEAEKAKREKDTKSFRENLEAAHELYRGEFMAGVYDDWAEKRRNYFTEQYWRILSGLAKLSFAEKGWSNALKFANEILQADPFREDVHRLVMRILAAQGKPVKVKEHYENLQELLKKELGVAPAPETRRTFQELLK